MKIILYLPNEEGDRQIEDEEENILHASTWIMRKLANILAEQQIRYESIDLELD